jgi:hypothetical protein
VPLPTARTLPALDPVVISAACRSSLVAVLLPTSGTTPRWRTGLTTAWPTPLQDLTWMLGATTPSLSGSHPPKLDAPPSSAPPALSSPCLLGTPSATTVLQVSYLEATFFHCILISKKTNAHVLQETLAASTLRTFSSPWASPRSLSKRHTHIHTPIWHLPLSPVHADFF